MSIISEDFFLNSINNQFEQLIIGEMNQVNQDEAIILKNILFLAEQSKKKENGERNLLNKWFQDSVKTYIFESIANPLIFEQLKLTSSAEVKTFIYSQADKNKPKYMGIIEQYYIHINKVNKQNEFVQKLKEILMDPIDITQNNIEQTYNVNKVVRKQFVCLLILKYFQMFGKLEIPSFYELWNICFPQITQKKKKLSRFDKKDEKKKQGRQFQTKIDPKIEESPHTSQNLIDYNCSYQIQNQQVMINQANSSLTNFHMAEDLSIKQQYSFQPSGNSSSYYKKQPINNQIFDCKTDDEEEEEEDVRRKFLNQINQYQQHDNNIATHYESDDQILKILVFSFKKKVDEDKHNQSYYTNAIIHPQIQQNNYFSMRELVIYLKQNQYFDKQI